jgi:hypothetical protein
MLLVPTFRLAALVVALVAVTAAFGAFATQVSPALAAHLAGQELSAHQLTPVAVFGLLWM